MVRQETLKTTLGDLVVALTEETTPFVRDEKEAYQVVGFMLTHLLSKPSLHLASWQMMELKDESRKYGEERKSKAYGKSF